MRRLAFIKGFRVYGSWLGLTGFGFGVLEGRSSSFKKPVAGSPALADLTGKG